MHVQLSIIDLFVAIIIYDDLLSKNILSIDCGSEYYNVLYLRLYSQMKLGNQIDGNSRT